jgi:hypothetical protein
MPDWVEPAAVVATAVATIVLAYATFRMVRSGDATARAAQRALEAQLRAVLLPARPEDPPQDVVFHDGTRLSVDGATAMFLEAGDVYAAVALRNVGAGLGVIYGWHLVPTLLRPQLPPAGPGVFRGQFRALYVSPGETGYWQARLDQGLANEIAAALEASTPMTLDLVYGDETGRLGRITRLHLRDDLAPKAGRRSCAVVQHWRLEQLDDWAQQQDQLREWASRASAARSSVPPESAPVSRR